MSRNRFKKQLSRVGDSVDDFIDDASDRYESVRDDLRRRTGRVRDRAQDVRESAEDAWDNRGDLVDDLVDGARSWGECATSYAVARFRRDPVGTVAVGAIGFWLVGKLLKR